PDAAALQDRIIDRPHGRAHGQPPLAVVRHARILAGVVDQALGERVDAVEADRRHARRRALEQLTEHGRSAGGGGDAPLDLACGEAISNGSREIPVAAEEEGGGQDGRILQASVYSPSFGSTVAAAVSSALAAAYSGRSPRETSMYFATTSVVWKTPSFSI